MDRKVWEQTGPSTALSTEQPGQTLQESQGFSQDISCQLLVGQGEGYVVILRVRAMASW